MIFHLLSVRLNRLAVKFWRWSQKIGLNTPNWINQMAVTFLILRFKTCPVQKSWWGKREESIKAIKTNTTPIFNKFFLILWFLCLIMTHRGNPYLLFLTVEAWGGGYAFLWSRCIITKYSSSCIESRWIKTYCFCIDFFNYSLTSLRVLTFFIFPEHSFRGISSGYPFVFLIIP
jgi:hypothetical protein